LSQFESQFEEDLYTARLDTLQKIVALGQQAYPNTFRFTHTLTPTIDGIPALLPLGLDANGTPKPAEALEAEHLTAAIAGRIVAIRLQGKAGFATLLQNGVRLQIYVRKDDVGEPAFDLYKLLDLGDHIGVRGTLMRTRTGELTLKAANLTEGPAAGPALTFLTKAMLPLPDKFSGLGDIELRYRRRYLDLFTDTGDSPEPTPSSPSAVILSGAKDPRISPEPATTPAPTPDAALKGTGFSPPVTAALEPGALAPEGQSLDTPQLTRLPARLSARAVFVKRAQILRSIRNFFDTRGYLEVETPMLHTVAGGAAARPFTTHHNALDIPLSLRIAPELYLKRLVVGGLDRVYEINRNFRNEGVSTQHNPEFTMLEFYQAYANYHDLMDLTQDLITTVAKEVNGTTLTNFNGTEIDLSKWTKLSMREAILKYWPPEATPTPRLDDLDSLDRFKPCVEILMMHFAHEHTRLGARRDHVHNTFPADSEIDAHAAKAQIKEITDEMVLADTNKWTLDRAIKYYDGKVYATVFEMLAEHRLIDPHIIYDFPLAVSPLSKIKPSDPNWVERFEFYIGGFEVGNAFSELNDPVDQRNRFAAQVEDKDPESMAAIDEDYVRALGYGLPPTAGEGIGIDRLTMILTGSRSIRDVILFPLMRPRTETPPD
jgi:lysyl-tRNA synthetase class 2